MSIVGGFASVAAATDQADPHSLSAEPLGLLDEMLWVDASRGASGLVNSFVIDPSDPLYGIYNDVCWFEDQAWALMASYAYRSSDPARCLLYANSVLAQQDPVSKEFPTLLRPSSGLKVNDLYRTRTQALCAYALALHLYFFPEDTTNNPIIGAAVQDALDRVISNYTAAGIITGLFYGGEGSVDEYLNYTPGVIQWTRTVDNFILWHAMRLCDLVFSGNRYTSTLAVLQDRINNLLWDGARFLHGGDVSTLDSEDSLEDTALGGLWLQATGDSNQAAFLHNRLALYQLEGTGYKPFLLDQWPGALDLIWMGGTWTSNLLSRRVLGDAQADLRASILREFRNDNSSWSQALVPESLLIKRWSSVRSTAWAVLALNPAIRGSIFN